MRSYRPRFQSTYINWPGKQIYGDLQSKAPSFTINYTPRKTVNDHNGPLSWIGKAEGETDKKYFCGEISELVDISDIPRIHFFKKGDRVAVKNTATGKTIVFECYGVDFSNSGEDIAGWNFKAIEGHAYPVEMLIIND